jgi:tol-pal system protein YbgF
VQIKLNDLDTRLARIERVMANQSLLDLANQTEALRGDLRAAHNDIDVLNHDLEAARKQQKDLYADIDRRLKSLELRGASGAGAGAAGSGDAGVAGAGAAGAWGAGGAAGGAAGAGSVAGPAADDKAAYQAAFEFLLTFPDSELADNAQYWLGEAYYVNKSYPEAQAAFQRVVDKYPGSRKRPDALLKIGYCRYELQQWTPARQILTQVATQFADTQAGHLAQQRLDLMATENH